MFPQHVDAEWARRLNTCEVIAEWFERAGIDRYFGYAGGAIWPLLDALIDKPHIRGIQAKHEAHAVHMADAYFRLTGKLAPVLVTRGPGLLNTPGAIAGAMHDSSAVMVIAGCGPTHFFGKAGYQEVFYHGAEESAGVFKPITKGTFLLVRPDVVNDVFNQAHKLATTGRPGPVMIQLPLDVQQAQLEGEVHPPAKRTVHTRIGADSNSLRRAAELIRDAERPLLVAGGGVKLARGAEALNRFVDTLRIPTATTLVAKGALSEDHELSVGALGRSGTNSAVDAAREADLIVAVGARFSDNHTSNWRDGKVYDTRTARIVQVDVDPAEVGRNVPVELGVVSDAVAFFDGVLEHGLVAPPDRSPWLERIAELRRDWQDEIRPAITSNDAPMHPARVVHDVGEAIASRGRVYIEMGDVTQYAEVYLTARSVDAWQANPGMAAMGWSCCAVLGSLALDRDTPAIAIAGDGAFNMVANILGTAVESDLPGIWVVLNNWGFSIERKGSVAAFGRAHPWIDFRRADTGEDYNPDFVALARAYGAEGVRIDTADDFRPALEVAIAARRPTVIEVPVDRTVPSFFTKGIDRDYPSRWAESYPAVGHMRLAQPTTERSPGT
jgi:acetolactate synthase I/II/III large subunit